MEQGHEGTVGYSYLLTIRDTARCVLEFFFVDTFPPIWSGLLRHTIESLLSTKVFPIAE
jgi:hypothetical protein